MKGAAAAGIVMLLLAGCLGDSPAKEANLPALDLVAMSLETVPLEPAEGRGVISLAWQDGRMAVSTFNEAGMPAQAVRDGRSLFTTQAGMGWTRWDLDAYTAGTPRGFRYLAWDVPELLSHAKVTTEEATRFTATSSYSVQGHATPVEIVVDHDGSTVMDITIKTAQDPESPFSLRPLGHELAFPAAVPAPARPADEVQRLDGVARAGHARILGWVKQYRDQTGRLPQDLSADSLVVQRLGQPWPTDPYDDKPMANQVASGHFQWLRCSDQDAAFHGFGWDGAPLNQDFGLGCSR